MQMRAIDLLLHGLTDTEVAAQLGIARTTLFRWRKKEYFARRLRTYRERLFDQSLAGIQQTIQPSLEILTRQLSNADNKLAMHAAATLLRIATSANLRAAHPPARKRKRTRATPPSEITPGMQAIADYINAPMPGETTSSARVPKFKW
jgi:hypothetical protein